MTAAHTRRNIKQYWWKQKYSCGWQSLFSVGQKRKEIVTGKTIKKKPHNPFGLNKKENKKNAIIITPWLRARLAGKSKLCFAPWDQGTFARIQTGVGGTGLLSGQGGKPRGGHAVECSSSGTGHVLLHWSVASTTHIHTCTDGMLETRLWHLGFTKRLKVRKDMKVSTISEELRLKTSTWLTSKTIDLQENKILWEQC